MNTKSDNARPRLLLCTLLGVSALLVAGCEGETVASARVSAALVERDHVLQLYAGQHRQVALDVVNTGDVPLQLHLDLAESSASAEVGVVQDGLDANPGQQTQLVVSLAALAPGYSAFAFDVRDGADGDVLAQGGLYVDVQEPPSCDDDNACTEDVFDLAKGVCTNLPSRQGQSCGGGNLCVDNAICHDGVCVGDAVVCDDGVACTVDTCEPDVGCTAVTDDTQCNDDDPCTDNVCTESGCESTPKADGSMCFFDGCAGVGTCVNQACVIIDTPDGTPCDDGDTCTDGDHCQAGACVGQFIEGPAASGIALTDIIYASTTVCGDGACATFHDLQVQKLLAAETINTVETAYVWTAQPVSPVGEQCGWQGTWPQPHLWNQIPGGDTDRDGPVDEAPAPPPDAPPEQGEQFIPCQTPVMLTVSMPGDMLWNSVDPVPDNAEERAPPPEDQGAPQDPDEGIPVPPPPEPASWTTTLGFVDEVFDVKVVPTVEGTRVVVVHVNERHLGQDARVDVFDLWGTLLSSTPLDFYVDAADVALTQDPVDDSMVLVVAPRQRDHCRFCTPPELPPTLPANVAWPPMEWQVYRFRLPSVNVFPGGVADDAQFMLLPTAPLYVPRETDTAAPRLANWLNLRHLNVGVVGENLALAGQLSLHDAGTDTRGLALAAFWDAEAQRYVVQYETELLDVFTGVLPHDTLAIEPFVDADGDLHWFSQHDVGCSGEQDTVDELCIPQRKIVSDRRLVFEHDPSVSATFGMAPLDVGVAWRTTSQELQRVEAQNAFTIVSLDDWQSFYGPPRAMRDGGAAVTVMSDQGLRFGTLDASAQCLDTVIPFSEDVD